MFGESRSISRRQFLKLAGVTGAAIGAGAGLGGLMAACGDNTATTTTAATTATTAASTSTSGAADTTASSAAQTTTSLAGQAGGILKSVALTGLMNIGLPGEMTGIMDQTHTRQAGETLVMQNAQHEAEPWLATAWEWAADMKSVTFTLRQGVKFHDGTDFNAAAVKYNFDMRIGKPYGLLGLTTAVDVVDDYAVKLTLSDYDPSLLWNLQEAAIYSPTALASLGKDAATHPVGTGPFKFVSYDRDVSLKFERFADYWQKDKGLPYLDGIQFDFFADPMTALAALQSGTNQSMEQLPNLQAASGLKEKGFSVNAIPALCLALTPSSANADSPFAKLAVRQAVAYAVDNATINQQLGFGFTVATNQFALPDDESLAYNPEVVGYPYDPATAKQLLADAGYPNGFETNIYYEAEMGMDSLFTACQGFLSAVGINAKLNPLERGKYAQMTSTDGWEGLIESSTRCDLWSDAAAGIAENFSSRRSKCVSVDLPADYNTQFDQAYLETDPAKRKTQFRALQKRMIDEMAIAAPIYVWGIASVASDKVGDFRLGTTDSPVTWHTELVWLKQ